MKLFNPIFVFGSNEAGRHGAGAARHASKMYGAVYGVGVGRCGQSYAIPTKDRSIDTLPLSHIFKYVEDFCAYAQLHNTTQFALTKIGCGLAGYTEQDIAPMFVSAPSNVHLVDEQMEVLCKAKDWESILTT